MMGNQSEKIIRRDLLGKTSACKTLKKTDSCEAINEDCARGHALVEQLLSNMKIANFPLKELLDSESKLLTFVNATLTQSLQSLLSGLEGPRIAVKAMGVERICPLLVRVPWLSCKVTLRDKLFDKTILIGLAHQFLQERLHRHARFTMKKLPTQVRAIQAG